MVQLSIIFIVEDREVLQKDGYIGQHTLMSPPSLPNSALTNDDIQQDEGHKDIVTKEENNSYRLIATIA